MIEPYQFTHKDFCLNAAEVIMLKNALFSASMDPGAPTAGLNIAQDILHKHTQEAFQRRAEKARKAKAQKMQNERHP